MDCMTTRLQIESWKEPSDYFAKVVFDALQQASVQYLTFLLPVNQNLEELSGMFRSPEPS